MQGKELPLRPYRALDLADDKGFLCGKMLGDLGADVIKIEPPGGDHARNRSPFYQDIPHPEKSLYWFAFNNNKRSITLNVETRTGQGIFYRLVKSADFVIESFTPGYMKKVGLGYDTLNHINPKVIMTSITPFGQEGPYKDYQAYDITLNAISGQMYATGDPDRAPIRIDGDQTYYQSGAQAAVATLIAHYFRVATGEGQYVDISMQECVLRAQYSPLPFYEFAQSRIPRQGDKRRRGQITQHEVWRCKDGYVIWRFFGGIEGSRQMRGLVDWMDSEGMADEALKERARTWETSVDFQTLTQEQVDHWERLFSEFFLTHTKDEIYYHALKRKIPVAPINDVRDLVRDEQLVARKYWVEIKHSELDSKIKYPGHFFLSNEISSQITRRAPLIGEHNEEIYEKELGFSKEELVILKEQNVI